MDPWEFDPAVWADPQVILSGGPESYLTPHPPVTLPRARRVGFTADLSDPDEQPPAQPFRFQPPV